MAGAREVSLPAQPFVDRGGRRSALPQQFDTTGEDNLRLISYSGAFDAVIRVQGRRLTENGDIASFAWSQNPTSDRLQNVSDFPLGRGALYNINVSATAANKTVYLPPFITLQIVRGMGSAAIVLGTLLQGYLPYQQSVAWPGSPILNSLDGAGTFRELQLNSSGAGSDFSFTVPVGARWSLLSVFASLATSGIAGNRTPFLAFDDGAVGVGLFPPALVVPPITTVSFTWAPALQTAAPVGVTTQTVGTPTDIVLDEGYRVRSATSSLSATDVWQNIRVLVQEWLTAGS